MNTEDGGSREARRLADAIEVACDECAKICVEATQALLGRESLEPAATGMIARALREGAYGALSVAFKQSDCGRHEGHRWHRARDGRRCGKCGAYGGTAMPEEGTDA